MRVNLIKKGRGGYIKRGGQKKRDQIGKTLWRAMEDETNKKKIMDC